MTTDHYPSRPAANGRASPGDTSQRPATPEAVLDLIQRTARAKAARKQVKDHRCALPRDTDQEPGSESSPADLASVFGNSFHAERDAWLLPILADRLRGHHHHEVRQFVELSERVFTAWQILRFATRWGSPSNGA